MITPYPRTSEPYYSRDDETEVDNEPIRSEEEIYEETPEPNDDIPKQGSATGDDLDLLTQRRSQGWDAPRKNPYAPPEPEPDSDPESYTEYDTQSETPYETPSTDFETQPPPETEAQRAKRLRDEEWFNFRMETVNSPNSVGGISKTEFFKNGYTAAEYNDFAARKMRESRSAKRTKKNILARNGFEIGWRPPEPAKPLAPRRSVGEEVAGGISRSYDLLGLNGMMAGAMAYDNATQQQLSNSVFGELQTSNGQYDVLGIGFASEGVSSGSLSDLIGLGDTPRGRRSATSAGGIPDLFGFRGNSAAPRRRSSPRKATSSAKKPARKAAKKSGRATTSPKQIVQKKTAKIRKDSARISKKASVVKKSGAKKISGGKKTTTKKFSAKGGGRTAGKTNR